MDTPPPLIPGYRIIRAISSGGMASVYLAIQESFGREVALKVMSSQLKVDPGFSERFLREARIVAQMHHAAIVPVYDVGEALDHQYLSMEYLSGGDLKQRLQYENGSQLACQVCLAMADALDFAHRKGFVHRDIKPENILFREGGSPVLTDFGIARAIDSAAPLTRAGTLVGTPSYMSPEQMRGEEVDGRSDLYSLGIVFYETLTGSVPFRADSTISVAIKHLSESLPPLPPAYAAYQPFLDRLAAKERDRRFATGAEVMRALSAIGVVAPPPASGPTQRSATPAEPTLVYEPLTAWRESISAQRGPVTARRGGGAREHFEPERVDDDHLATGRIVPRRESTSGTGGDRRRTRDRRHRRSGWRIAAVLLLAAGAVALWQLPALHVPLVEAIDGLMQGGGEPALAERLTQADERLAAGDLDAALAGYGAVLARDGDNAAALAGLDRVAASHLDTARAALRQGDGEGARRALQHAQGVAPEHAGIPALEAQIEAERRAESERLAQADEGRRAEQAQREEEARRVAAAKVEADAEAKHVAEESQRRAEAEQRRAQEAQREAAPQRRPATAPQSRSAVQVGQLLSDAEAALARGDLTKPDGASAVDYYRQVLQVNPRNTTAHTGLLNVHARLLADAERDLKQDDLASAGDNLAAARALIPSHPETAKIEALYRQKEAELREQGRREQARLSEAWNHLETVDELLGQSPVTLFTIDIATRRYDQAAQLAPQLAELATFRARITEAYSAAVRTALNAGNRQEALAAIDHARRRNWLTPLLQQQEEAIRQQLQVP
jgi:hypothetical protein